jgi:hypothetical protein
MGLSTYKVDFLIINLLLRSGRQNPVLLEEHNKTVNIYSGKTCPK